MVPPTKLNPNAAAVISRRSSSKPKPSSDLATAAASNTQQAVAEQDHLALAKPLDFDMASRIDGQESQMVSFELQPGQIIRVSGDAFEV